MSSDDLIVMVVLDGCFIIEVLQQVCGSEAQADVSSPIVMAPWLIPVITRDLLKLENQILFFLLQHLFDLSMVPANTGDPLTLLAKVKGPHLLNQSNVLFHLSLL